MAPGSEDDSKSVPVRLTQPREPVRQAPGEKDNYCTFQIFVTIVICNAFSVTSFHLLFGVLSTSN